jgi:hypothetical protein
MIAHGALQTSEVPVTPNLDVTRSCRHCTHHYVPKKRTQQFCSVRCRVAHFRRDEPKNPVKQVQPRHGRKARDGLRCCTCQEFIDNREGWRLDCKSCSRRGMLALHNRARCTRRGCLICMEPTLEQSEQFVAAWIEAEAAGGSP